jgi:O-antigen ligase
MIRTARYLFLASLATLPVVRLLSIPIGGLTIQISDFLFLFCFLAFVISVIGGQHPIKVHRAFIYIAIYWSALLLSAIFSEDQSKSLLKMFGETYLFLLGFVAAELCRDGKFMKRAVGAWLTGTTVAVIGSLAGLALFYLGLKTQLANPFLSHFGSLPAGDYPRIRGFFANANMMANYMNFSIMLVLAASGLGMLRGAQRIILKVGAIIASVLTLSPGLGGVALSLGLWTGRRSRMFAIVGVLIAGFFVVASLVSGDTKNTDLGLSVGGRVIEPSVRVLVWDSALGTIASNPLLGRGVGIDPANLHYEAVNGDKQHLRDAHNIPVNVAGQAGLLGLAAFAAFAFFTARWIRQNAAHNEVTLALALGVVGAFYYQGLTGSFEDARHLWVALGMMFASREAFDGTSGSVELRTPAAT